MHWEVLDASSSKTWTSTYDDRAVPFLTDGMGCS